MFLLIQYLKSYLVQNRYQVGLFFALFVAVGSVSTYKFYIKDYYFVTPSSNELLGLSVIAFLVSLYMIYEQYFVKSSVVTATPQLKSSLFTSFMSSNVSLYARVPYVIALIFGFIALIVAIVGETSLYPKHYGTTALKIIILLSALCCLHLYCLKINLYRNFYTHMTTNKLEIVLYAFITTPYLVVTITFIPGGWNVWDASYQLAQALGVYTINDWHPVFITFLFRLFHFFPYESGLYFFRSICVYLPVAYIFSKLFKKSYNYIVYIVLLYVPFFSHILFATSKQSEAALFIFSAVLMFIAYTKVYKNIYLILAFIFFAFASYSRLNQILQVMVLLIPVIIFVFKYKVIDLHNFMKICYVLIILTIVIELPNKFIFRNPNLIIHNNGLAWDIGSSIAYIAFRQENLNLIPKEYRDREDIRWYYANYLKMKDKPNFNPVLDSVSIFDHDWKPFYHYDWINIDVKEGWYLIKLSLNHLGTALEHRYYVFMNFINGPGEVSIQYNFYYSRKETFTPQECFHNANMIGKAKFDAPFSNSSLFNFIVDNDITPFFLMKYKYIFIAYLFMFFLSFVLLRHKFLPNINIANKNMCLIYYMTLSNIILFSSIVILDPVGWEKRYLLASYPLTGLAVLLFVQELPRYLSYYNKRVTRFVQNRLGKTT